MQTVQGQISALKIQARAEQFKTIQDKYDQTEGEIEMLKLKIERLQALLSHLETKQDNRKQLMSSLSSSKKETSVVKESGKTQGVER